MKDLFLKFTIIIGLSLAALVAHCQNHITWESELKKTGDKAFTLTLYALIDSGYHTYSQVQEENCICFGTQVWTEFGLRTSEGIKLNGGRLLGDVIEEGKREEHDDSIAGKSYWYKKNMSLALRLRTKEDSVRIRVTVKYQVCTETFCYPPTEYKKVFYLVNHDIKQE